MNADKLARLLHRACCAARDDDDTQDAIMRVEQLCASLRLLTEQIARDDNANDDDYAYVETVRAQLYSMLCDMT